MNIMRIKKTIVYRVLAKIKNPIVRLIMNIGTVKSQLVESIYIINLQNHPERMANIIHHLKKCAIPVCRIDAVKGYEFPDNYCQLYAPNATLALTRGQVAVTLSHRKAWTQMLKTSQKIAWFFEDDARIKYFFARHLDKWLSEISDKDPHWDIIYTYKTTVDYFYDVTYQNGVLPFMPREKRPVDQPFTLHGCITGPTTHMVSYLLSRKGAQKLLDITADICYPLDVQIPLKYNEINMYSLNPLVSYFELDGISDTRK